MTDPQVASVTPGATLVVLEPTDQAGEGAGEGAGIEDFGELPGRPLRKRFGPLTYLLLGLIVACGAFYGGARYGQSQVTSSSTGVVIPSAASRSSSSRLPSFSFGTAVSGTIKLLTGKNFFLEESTGTILKVTTSAGTTISISSAGSVSQLHPGDSVTVLGSKKNGTVAATRVSDAGNAGAGGTAGTHI